MARKVLNETENVIKDAQESNQTRLVSLVESYIENKACEKKYKDLASSENTEIKVLMTELQLNKVATDSGVATLSERVSEDFIEEKLIEFLKTHNVATDIVKTKEYVDFDALESAIYNERIPADIVKDMASCKEKKVTQVLRINKKKGE